jgi:hypothetical protein
MKKIVIDGHNLIPKIPGIRLSDPDDENKLIRMVGEYCRLSRAHIDLFFDGAPAGSSPRSKHGLVNVHHVKVGLTADDAIIHHLRKEGVNARNILVVSSDHRVKTESKALHAEVMNSEQFAQTMLSTLNNPAVSESKRELPPSTEEVDEMLDLMLRRKNSSD